jgi:hypothetical protein
MYREVIGISIMGASAALMVLMLVLAIRGSRVIRAHVTAEAIEALLSAKPWYLSRFRLIAWEYLMVEAEIAGLDQEERRRRLRIDRLRGGGPWHWRYRRISLGSPGARSIGASVFVLGGLFWFWVAFNESRSGLLLMVMAAATGILCATLALQILAGRDPNIRLGRRLSALRNADPQHRQQMISQLAHEFIEMNPDLVVRAVPSNSSSGAPA